MARVSWLTFQLEHPWSETRLSSFGWKLFPVCNFIDVGCSDDGVTQKKKNA